MEERQCVEKQADEKDVQRALADLRQDGESRDASVKARAEGQRDGGADDEQKEGKDKISERAAIPDRMTKLRV